MTRQTYEAVRFDKSTIRHRIFEYSGSTESKCRSLILDLNRTHLKNKYQGILLGATVVDTNSSLFPLTYAVVDAENDEHWLWFLQNLHRIVGAYAPQFLEPAALTLLSNCQMGLLIGVGATFLNSPHGYCLGRGVQECRA